MQHDRTPLLRRVTGFLVPPEKVTSGPAKMRIFVNGRAVRDRMILHAVGEGLRGFLMKGKNPSGLIHLNLPPEEVDVNVHPAKHEVRFRNSRDIHALLSHSVAGAMQAHQQTIRSTFFGPEKLRSRTPFPADSAPLYMPPTEEPSDATKLLEEDDNRLRQHHSFPTDARQTPAPKERPMSAETREKILTQPLLVTAEPMQRSSAGPKQLLTQQDKEQQPNRTAHNLIIVGQYDDLYIFCKTGEGLLVIDQHAAHERLLYEKLHQQYLAGTVVRQTLMFPETVELSIFQTQLVEKNQDELQRIGFSIREFGGNTYIISAIPALAGLANARDLFFDILEQFGSEDSKGDTGGFLDTIIATMACKAAVKAGTPLSSREIDTLLNDMAEADLFSHCPHGRPVVKHFTKDEVKKWFYRT